MQIRVVLFRVWYVWPRLCDTIYFWVKEYSTSIGGARERGVLETTVELALKEERYRNDVELAELTTFFKCTYK